MYTDFGIREAPSAPYVHYLVKKVKETSILIDKSKREKPKTVRTFGAQKTRTHTSHCLVRILVQRHNWAIFPRK